MNFEQISTLGNLTLAWRKASKGKRTKQSTACFEYQLADKLLELKHELENGSYMPGPYTHFTINEPKRRLISAAPFRDRVVHHALCNVIEPAFEARFIPDSYANRVARGTHYAIDRLQQFSRHYRYVLRMDIVQHFPSIDHEVLYDILSQVIIDERILWLVRQIIQSGDDVLSDEYKMAFFPGDDLLACCRPRGLPIGNLTSQFWSNCYLHPLDMLIKRELGCRAYLRYVDDFALFANDKSTLWSWKKRIISKLAELRLRAHQNSAQVCPVSNGIPWLGFVVYPAYRRVKRRKVVHASKRLTSSFDQWQTGKISFAEFDARIKGWVNHVNYADSWGLRKHLLGRFVW